MLTPQPADTAEYIRMLRDDPNTVVCWQTFPDFDKSNKNLICTWHASLNDALPTLVQLNQAGAGVFINVTLTDGVGRTRDNITGADVCFIDCDGTLSLNDFNPEIPCTFIVKRDDTHFHAYWRMKHISIKDWQYAQRVLAEFYGTDPKVNKPTQVMRVPGFWHQKNPKTPYLVELMR